MSNNEDETTEQTAEPLTYRVEERTKTTRAGGWGKREITEQRLSPSKTFAEMTDRQRELYHRVDHKNDVPADAEEGDEYRLDDLLDDARTTDERDADAIAEAAETGEEVLITETTTDCNDAQKECNLDHVRRIATPDGNIEVRRTHTY